MINIQKKKKAANNRAEQIYGPVVERRQRVEKVKGTLYMLQRYRFLFNLPNSLMESIKQVVCIFKKGGCGLMLYRQNMKRLFEITKRANTCIKCSRVIWIQQMKQSKRIID